MVRIMVVPLLPLLHDPLLRCHGPLAVTGTEHSQHPMTAAVPPGTCAMSSALAFPARISALVRWWHRYRPSGMVERSYCRASFHVTKSIITRGKAAIGTGGGVAAGAGDEEPAGLGTWARGGHCSPRALASAFMAAHQTQSGLWCVTIGHMGGTIASSAWYRSHEAAKSWAFSVVLPSSVFPQ